MTLHSKGGKFRINGHGLGRTLVKRVDSQCGGVSSQQKSEICLAILLRVLVACFYANACLQDIKVIDLLLIVFIK